MSPSAEKDVTGWCAKGNHDGCDGTLHAGRGLHWFCACACHPEPSPNGPGGQERQQALAVWQAARTRVTSPDVSATPLAPLTTNETREDT